MFKLVLKSIVLDWEFLQLALPISQKLHFIFIKYSAIAYSALTFGKSLERVSILGSHYYIDHLYALGILQATFVDHTFLKSFIPKKATIIDIGANIGQSNFFYKKYLNAKTVYSFEPVSSTFNLLKKNGKTKVFNRGISTKKSIKMYLPSLSVWASSIKPENVDQFEIAQCVRLDTMPEIKKLKKIDFIKIDVEGAEVDAIDASKKTILKSEYIFIEASVHRATTGSFKDILKALEDISPHIELIRVGKIYNNTDNTTGSADLLFRNTSL